MVEPQPGMTGLTHISGTVGMGIRAGQWLNREGFSTWEHAFKLLPEGFILEAEPGGAVIRPLHYAPQDIYWCHGLFGLLDPGWSRQAMWDRARPMEGIPYSFLDYDALAARRLGVPDVRVWPNRADTEGVPREGLLTLREFIKDTGHMICSQMCDEFDLRMGAHDFTDGRWPQDVTPAGLWKRDLQLLAGA